MEDSGKRSQEKMDQKQKRMRQKEQQDQAEEQKRWYWKVGSNRTPWDSRQGGDIINYHYIIVNISTSVQYARAKTANEHDGLILREIQPGDFLSAISLVALMNLEGKFARFGFVHYGKERTPVIGIVSAISLPAWSMLSATATTATNKDTQSSHTPRMRTNYRYL